MKTILVCFAILALWNFSSAEISEDEGREVIKMCLKQHSARDEHNFLKGSLIMNIINFEEDCADVSKKSKQVLKCFLDKINFIDDKERLNVKNIYKEYPIMKGFEETSKKCFALQRSSNELCENILAVGYCFRNEIKQKIGLEGLAGLFGK